MQYRADIDGLRSLAIVPIVLFHAGFSLFSGGFVGVDIFFVISGYLITSIIAKEIGGGQFDLWRFYERRIRRIFPALIVMLLVCSVAGWVLLFPLDLQAFGESLVASTGFVANISFWLKSGYFDTSSDLKPLLHTWSLAVEEQFYLFFPLVLMLANRKNRDPRLIVWIILLLSFALSLFGVSRNPDATFYLIPTRAWELLIGSVLALNAVPAIKNHTVRPGFPLRSMEPLWGKRAMQFTDLATGDLNMQRYAELMLHIGYPQRYCKVMGTNSAPLVVEAESAHKDLDYTSANGIAYVRDHFQWPAAGGSFEDGMGA